MAPRRVMGGHKQIALSVWMKQSRHNALTHYAKQVGLSRAEFVRRCIEANIPQDLFVPSCCLVDEEGKKVGCVEAVVNQCWCDTCLLDPPEDRLYVCKFHMAEAIKLHELVRGTRGVWGPLEYLNNEVKK